MVHHVSLFKLKPEVTPEKLEQIMMTTRMTLLKIPEILSVRCGKNIDLDSEWPFFIALDFESLEKLAMTEDDAIYMKFVCRRDPDEHLGTAHAQLRDGAREER